MFADRAPSRPDVKVRSNWSVPPTATVFPTAGEMLETTKSPMFGPDFTNAKTTNDTNPLLVYVAWKADGVPMTVLPKFREADPETGSNELVATWLLDGDSPWLLPDLSPVT